MNNFLQFIVDNKIALILFLVSFGMLTGIFPKINTFFNWQNDNPAEQEIEEIIKDETGLDVDLTPNTKDKDNAT